MLKLHFVTYANNDPYLKTQKLLNESIHRYNKKSLTCTFLFLSRVIYFCSFSIFLAISIKISPSELRVLPILIL
jgi:hypothetical protein